MIIVRCPQCNQTTEAEGPYDENVDEMVQCTHCDWVSPKWTFEYDSEEVYGN